MFRSITYSWYILALVLLYGLPAQGRQAYDTTEIISLIDHSKRFTYTAPDSTISLLREALSQSEQAYFANGIILGLPSLYDIYINKGLYDSVATLSQEILAASNRSIKLQTAIPTVYDILGNLYKAQGKYETAMQYYLKALELADKYGIPSASVAVYNNIGSLLFALERDQEALFYLDKAEKAAQHMGNYKVWGYALINKGLVYMYKDTAQSRLCFEKAIILSRKYQIMQVEYLALTDLSNLYIAAGMPKEALSCLLQTQSLRGDIDPHHESIAIRTLGLVYQQLHDYKNAEYYLQKAILLSDKHQLARSSLDSRQCLAQLYAEEGKYEQAFSNLNTYVQIYDSINNLNVRQNLNQLEIKYRTAEKDKQLIQNQLQISKSQLQISKQESRLRQKNLWIIGITSSALLLAVLLFGLYRNNQHKQKLQDEKMKTMEQEQEIGQLKAMMKGEENERGRLARELHDGIGGMLSSINMNLDVIKSERSEGVYEKLDKVIDMLQDTSTEVRKTAHNLMPDVLLQHSLQDVLITYCRNIDINNRLQVNLQFDGELGTLDKSIELILYRIIQELLQNIIKHAKATEADVLLLLSENKLTVSVEDNGVGFDVNGQYSGYGLQNLQYRVHALQGEISIASHNGTAVFIIFDLDKLKKI